MYLIREIRRQSYYREFVLPERVDIEKVRAKYENGVRVVELPKIEHEKRKGKPVKIE